MLFWCLARVTEEEVKVFFFFNLARVTKEEVKLFLVSR